MINDTHENRRNLANKQLEIFHRQIEADRNRRITTRNWFATVWAAVLLAISSDRLGTLEEITQLLLLIILIGTFWILETFAQTFVFLNSERAEKLEMRLMQDDFSTPLVRDNFFLSGWKDVPYARKLRAFMSVLLTTESVWAFYVVALFSSIGFVFSV